MIYKTLKKVSDYCQLVDKRNFPETQTVYGVTFTNNGDGSITVNGTSTNQYYSSINLEVEIDKLVPGHTYIFTLSTSNINGLLLFEYPGSYILKPNNNIFVLPEYEYTRVYISIRVAGGNTASNATAKPQLFDLTEMYGAGNEPTTVEEFRTKFPNELYDYKPYCFVKSYKTLLKATDNKIITSYKKSLICTTKNLFDYTKVNGLEHTSTGNPYSDYLKINGESFGVMAGLYDRGVNFIPHFILDAGTYTISLIAKGTSPGDKGPFGIIKFNSDGTKPSFTKQWVTSDSRQSYTFTLDENSEIAIRVQGEGNASNAKNLDSTFSNIQLEEGDTATEYHPYGYL